MSGRRGSHNRYELLTCAWKGHVLVGTDAARVEEDDDLVVREYGGIRLHRCLRCDDWVMRGIPLQPRHERVESRDEIEMPARGPALRDRYVLRLIALERAIHVVVLTLLAVALFSFARHSQTLHRDYVDIMNDLSGGDPGASTARGFLGYLGKVFKYSPADLIKLGFVVSAYGALEAVEMVGLWLAKRWAEYLTFVATSVLIPYEIYELSRSVTAFKAITFAINLVIVLYLLLAKRLFGLRGGQRAELHRRQEQGGWGALEKATIPSQ